MASASKFYYSSDLLERMMRQRAIDQTEREEFNARFEEFVKEERAKQGHYETNEWGEVCA